MTPTLCVAIGSLLIAATSLALNFLDRLRHRRRLIRIKVEQAELIPGDRSNWNDLAVFWGRNDPRQELKKPRFVRVMFTNLAKDELTVKDTDAAASVRISSGRIIAARLWILDPPAAPDPQPRFKLENQFVQAARVMINPKNTLMFEILVDGDDCEVTAHIRAARFKPLLVPAQQPRFTRAQLTMNGAVFFGALGLVTGILGLFF